MAATLKLTHKAIGVEVRRGTFDVVVDGKRVESLEMNNTVEVSVEPGGHTLQVRNGRNSSRTQNSTPPRARSSPSDAAGRGSCRSSSSRSSFRAWRSSSFRTDGANDFCPLPPKGASTE